MTNYINISIPGVLDKTITINDDYNDFDTSVYNVSFFENIINFIKLKLLMYDNNLKKYTQMYSLFEEYERDNSNKLMESINKLDGINKNDRKTYYQNEATQRIEKYYTILFYIYYVVLIIFFILYFLVKPNVSIILSVIIGFFMVTFPLFSQYALSIIIDIIKNIYYILPKNSYLS